MLIIGSIGKDEKRIRFQIDIVCTKCQKKVPGGMTASERYFYTLEFRAELNKFRNTYLCGICRDAQRRKLIRSR